MRRLAGVSSILVLCAALLTPVAAANLPPELAGWEAWVLKDQEFLRCPFFAITSPGDPGAHRCAWPEPLTLAVDADGGRFAQRWQVYADSWVVLPGNLNQWPEEVRSNGVPAPLVARGGLPAVRLAPGSYALSGRFTWETRPEALPIAAETGVVELTVDGRVIAQPERPDGAVSLGKRRTAEQPAALEVQVYRLVQDELPVRLVTRVRLQVAGDAREERFAEVLPAGFVPLTLESVLPARLDADGRLRVQVRAGSYELTVTARGSGAADTLSRPPPAKPVAGRWAREEIWSFAGNDRLRIAAAEGANAIDPAQANVPLEWQGLPAFRMAADSKLAIVERSRGLANVDDNRLTLNRQLWLDFDHAGLTAVDRIAGTMRRDWRLDMAAPYTLQSARLGSDALLVTTGTGPGATGVELRQPELAVESVSRTASPRSLLPATGWQTRFDGVQGTLHLPPGHLLLAVRGADDAPGSWLEQWGLWNLFGVLIVVVFTAWVAGNVVAVVALGALLLMYQYFPEQIWLWGNLLAAIAVARAVPEGRFRRVAGGFRTLSFVVLGFALLPFLADQVRLALYPQLEPGVLYADARAMPDIAEMTAPGITADSVVALESVESDSVAVNSSPELRRDKRGSYGGLNAQQVVQRYAPGTLVQTGPGLPGWNYNSYPYSWSGPVEPDQTVQFIYIGRVLLAVWRIVGAVLTAILFLWLLQGSLPGFWQRQGWAGRRSAGTGTVLATAVSAALLIAAAPGPVLASSTPDPALLNELKTRLSAPPPCAPTCAEILGNTRHHARPARGNADGERAGASRCRGPQRQRSLAAVEYHGRW